MTHVGEIHGRPSSMGMTPLLEQGKSVRRPPCEEKVVAETTCDEMTVTAVSCPPELLRGEKTQFRSEVELERKEGEGVFKILVLFLNNLL